MAFVLDASIAAAWYLADETAPLAEHALELLQSEPAVAPTLLWYELRNLFIVQERRRRIAASAIAEALVRITSLQIALETPDSDEVMALARSYRLTVYDASYLSLALGGRIPLATLDRELAAAARRAGVELLSA